ncbi:MAG: 4Fe-4S binding protein [Anaerolineae bacterium]|nr:MAG: 4Fe-4S binding protein [Anaerolineae bacterium]
MEINPYKALAQRLDALPNGFPPTDSGLELDLLAKIFSAEEADLAAQLRLKKETAKQIASRLGAETSEISRHLKAMARRGVITAGRVEGGLGFGLMPFVVGIYEMQVDSLDKELAALFEEYYQRAFGQLLAIEPQVHRVIPVGESIGVGIEIQPYESATEIVEQAQDWGVLECICRKQKMLLGDPCQHPIDVCMAISQAPDVFGSGGYVRKVSKSEALATLRRASEAGLVHSVSNNQQGLAYICNCCTCSCAILRGIAELGIANAVARSNFVNQVEESLCVACGDCLDFCQFDALTMDEVCHVNEVKCVGCGVCVPTCPEDALGLVRRPIEETQPIPRTMTDWMAIRARERRLDLSEIL